MTPHALRPLVAAVAALLAQPGHALDCGMAPAFQQKDGNTKSGVTSVWADPAAKSLL